MTAQRDRRLPALTGFLDRHTRVLFAAILAVLAVGCLAGLWRATAVIGLRVPLDPNEGWNAYHAASTMAGHGPYPAATSFMTNNYPPLSFYLVGVFGAALGDNIVAGRIVSLLSFVVVATGIAVLADRFACGKREAAFASFLFAGFLLVFSDYVGMDDPQMLGHALQIGGLAILFTENESPATELTSAALFVAAMFVKHNLVAMPVAAIIWLSVVDWRRASRIAAVVLALGLAGLAAGRIAFGFDLLSRLNSPRSYSLALFATNFHDWLVPAALPLTATLGLVTIRERFAVFCITYALVSVAIGGAFLGGAGVDANVMFDADIAIALGTGLALDRVGATLRHLPALTQPIFAVALVLPLALGLARAFESDWLEIGFWLHPMRDEARTAQADIAYLQARKGPAMCEMLSLCYWAAKPATADIFNLNQQYQTGARDDGPLAKLIEAHAFAVIQFDSFSPVPFPANVQAAIWRNYRIDRTSDDGVFLVPRSAGS